MSWPAKLCVCGRRFAPQAPALALYVAANPTRPVSQFGSAPAVAVRQRALALGPDALELRAPQMQLPSRVVGPLTLGGGRDPASFLPWNPGRGCTIGLRAFAR